MMVPKRDVNQPHGRPKGPMKQKPASAKTTASTVDDRDSSDPFESADDGPTTSRRSINIEGEEEPEPEKTVPRDLVTRILHELFAKDATRISRDANAAVAKYVDIFVREAIARAAVEKRSGFFEVSLVNLLYRKGGDSDCGMPSNVAAGGRPREDCATIASRLMMTGDIQM